MEKYLSKQNKTAYSDSTGEFKTVCPSHWILHMILSKRRTLGLEAAVTFDLAQLPPLKRGGTKQQPQAPHSLSLIHI